MSGSRWSIAVRPSRTISWSSTSMTRITCTASGNRGQPRADRQSALLAVMHLEGAAQRFDLPAALLQPEMRAALLVVVQYLLGGAHAVVLDNQIDVVLGIAEAD